MQPSDLLPSLLAIPAAAALVCLLLPSARAVFAAVWCAVAATAAIAIVVAAAAASAGRIHAGNLLFADALSAFHLLVLSAVFAMSSLYAPLYFRDDVRKGTLDRKGARRFGALWLASFASMNLVLVSNNLGLLWVGIEATTLLTTFLICVHRTPASLEAMWKYLLLCSVGVAFAFMGTLLVAASAHRAAEPLVWTSLLASARSLDPGTLKAGFIFLLVGYGTKAGLAPMHNWLPDAHSQAPAPVSALFSGFMLNAALYCILRYVPLVERATGGSGWSLGLLQLFGLVSILVAAAFILFQHDLKRLLAYHSVEHLGIIALGMGLGGVGIFAALFHTLNHSLCKTLGFLCAGRLGQIYGTHDMARIAGTLRTSPVWGAGLFGSLLALIGVAPFALFMSEFLIATAAVDGRAYWALGIFLLGTGIVFVGALRHALAMAWGEPKAGPTADESRVLPALLVMTPLALLLVLGVWMPDPLREILSRAAAIIGGAP